MCLGVAVAAYPEETGVDWLDREKQPSPPERSWSAIAACAAATRAIGTRNGEQLT